jgi:hypothetical protein
LIRKVKQSEKENKKLALQLKVMEGPIRKATNVLLPSKCYIFSLQFQRYVTMRIGTSIDALPSPGVNSLEGSPKCSCGKLGLGRRSRLPTLERSRRSSWEPRD